MEIITIPQQLYVPYPLVTSYKLARPFLDRVMEIITNFSKGRAITLIGTGTSGASMAMFLQISIQDSDVLYVHVKEERVTSHRCTDKYCLSAHADIFDPSRAFFLIDDVIATGETMIKLIRRAAMKGIVEIEGIIGHVVGELDTARAEITKVAHHEHITIKHLFEL